MLQLDSPKNPIVSQLKFGFINPKSLVGLEKKKNRNIVLFKKLKKKLHTQLMILIN